MPGAPERASHARAIQVLAQVHQRQKSAKDPRLQVIRQVQPAGRHPGQPLTVLGDEAHDFPLAFLRRVPQRRFAAHLPAARFQSQGKVQHAQLLLGECRGRVVLASSNLAASSHGTRGAAR